MLFPLRNATVLAATIFTVHTALAVETPAAEPQADEGKHVFPLQVSENRRFLVDQEQRPFLVVGDTAWSLIADLKLDDIKEYLDDRRRRGFNSMIVNLIEARFATDPPRNRLGVEPFRTRDDFSTPNPEYFDFAHKVVEMANERGIVVWLCPAYLGWGGGDQGFFKPIQAGGAGKLRAYGRFVGARFNDSPNVIWMVGGDYAMPAEHRWAAVDLAVAIRDAGATQLITAHGGVQSAVETVGDQTWLGINNTYSYSSELFQDVRSDYRQKPVRPLVLIESAYENEHDSRPERIRRQAYWALTCGACGQFFGNNPIWHFDGPGLYDVQRSWREELDGAGSRDMAHLRNAFRSRPWHRLEPRVKQPLITSGTGDGTATVTAAATPDGTLAMIYIPSTGRDPRKLTADLRRFAGPITGIWYNPTNGRSSPVAEQPLSNAERHTFVTPGDNGTGTNDWLLILESEP